MPETKPENKTEERPRPQPETKPYRIRTIDPNQQITQTADNDAEFREHALGLQRRLNRTAPGQHVRLYVKAKDGNEYPIEEFLGDDWFTRAEKADTEARRGVDVQAAEANTLNLARERTNAGTADAQERRLAEAKNEPRAKK